MTRSDASRRRRWMVGGLVAVLAVVAIGTIVATFFVRDSATPVLLDQAVDDFRAADTTTESTTTTSPVTTTVEPALTSAPTSTEAGAPPTTTASPPTSAPSAPKLPTPGVYRYRTTGSEQIDALGGATHEYPAETTITIIVHDCGVRLRWDALRERRDEWTLCPTGSGIELQPESIHYHEFFGQPDEEMLTCDRSVVLVPAVEPPPEPLQLDCMLADDPWFPTWEVLEATTRTVDGTTIPVRHVRMTILDEDEFWERNIADWYLAADGLPVEVAVTKSSRSPSPIGGIVYQEQYKLELVSFDPLR